jgi:hypothetical protein
MSNSIFKSLSLGVIGAACLSLGTIGQAQAFVFTEASNGDAGFTRGTAADTTGLLGTEAVGLDSTIYGSIAKSNYDPYGEPSDYNADKNKVDLFKILIDAPGNLTAITAGHGKKIRSKTQSCGYSMIREYY